MKVVFTSALVAAATALPWEDSQASWLSVWGGGGGYSPISVATVSYPEVKYGDHVVDGSLIEHDAATNSWSAPADYVWQQPTLDSGAHGVMFPSYPGNNDYDSEPLYNDDGEEVKPIMSGEGGTASSTDATVNDVCPYFSVNRRAKMKNGYGWRRKGRGRKGDSPLEQNMMGPAGKRATKYSNINHLVYDLYWHPSDDSQTATKSMFCKACFGGDDVETTTKFCKACFGGDVEVQARFCKACFGGDDAETTARFCKACFGGDDAEVKARFCKSCFGGDDVATTVAFCKACFGGDDAEVKARFCKSCFGGDVETHARFCKSCFGGDDAEVHSRFCKSCFGGDVQARVKCDCGNNRHKNESHYGLTATEWQSLRNMMDAGYSVLAAAHGLGKNPEDCECALGDDAGYKIHV